MALDPVGWASLSSSLFASFHFSTLMCLSCLFFTFPGSWLALHVSWAFPVLCGLLFIPTVVYFLLASFTDTGILHKGIEEELVNQKVTMRALNQHWCNRCQLYCLPHTSHCSWCNTCVEEFDHHCMWLNNCVGCHNLRFFLLFVAFLSGYDSSMLVSCLAYLALNSHQPFSAEKICTVLVTIPTAFYVFPLLILLGSQIGYILTAQHKSKVQHHLVCSGEEPVKLCWDSSQDSTFCKQHRLNYTIRSATPGPKAGKPFCHTPQICSSSGAVPASFPQGSCCPQDAPSEQKAVKTWRRFLSAVGNLLSRKGPESGTSAASAAKEVDQKMTSWQLNSNNRDVGIQIPDTLDSLELLDDAQDIHWKCQIYINRRDPASPTATLLSVSDI